MKLEPFDEFRPEVEEKIVLARMGSVTRALWVELIEFGVRLGLEAARKAADNAELGKSRDDLGRERFDAGKTILNAVRAIRAIDPAAVLRKERS